MEREREYLYQRHKLSHQQIDLLLEEKESGYYPELKGQLLGKVRDFLEVSKLLSEAGISFIPLKGPMLSYRLYGDPSFRYFSDLDMLMELPELKKALLILLDEGYETEFYIWPEDPIKEQLLVSRDNQYNIAHPGKQIGIELHWRPFHYDIGPKEGIWPLLKENLDTIEYGGMQYHVFNPELEALYLVIHGGLHGFRWLRWLLDVRDLLLNINIDAGKFNDLCDKLQAHRMVALCNALMKEYFPGSALLPSDQKVSSYLLRSAHKAMAESSILPGNSLANAIRLNTYRLRCFPGMRFKKSLMKYTFYSSRQLQKNSVRSSFVYDIFRRIKRKLFHAMF